jgi:hypothetical protein
MSEIDAAEENDKPVDPTTQQLYNQLCAPNDHTRTLIKDCFEQGKKTPYTKKHLRRSLFHG